MARKEKISFPTKILSNSKYLNEIPVEGKKTPKFNFTIGYYDLYAAQIIRIGNCITLLSNKFSITEDTFWNANHYEDLAKYIFWTFNGGFLHKLQEGMLSQKISILRHCHKILTQNLVPYAEPIPENADEELKWCYVKNENLKNGGRHTQMYALDQENRNAFLLAIEKRMADLAGSLPQRQDENRARFPESGAGLSAPGTPTLSFLELLRPMNGSQDQTLQFINSKTQEAGFPFDLFLSVPRLANGKNPYGLNGCIGAMIETFHRLGYFQKGHSQDEIFQAYFRYSSNTIAKYKTFLSEFRDERYFKHYFSKLNDLKINKLP